MSSSALRVVAILLAVGAAVLGYIGYQASQNTLPTQTETVEAYQVEPVSYPIVIAAKDIAADQRIAEDDINVTLVNRKIRDSFTEQQPLIGLTSRMEISAGDMLLPEHFQALSSITTNLHPGERAIAVKVDEVTGVGGYIEPGDKVDVLLFLPAGQETDKKSSSQLLLPALRVIAFGNQLDELDQQQIRQKSRAYQLPSDGKPLNELLPESNTTQNDGKPTGKQSKTAVLAVNQALVSTLLLAESTGRIRLALVGKETPGGDNKSSQVSDQNNHFISLETLTNRPTEPVPSPKITATPSPVKPSTQKLPTKVTVHRGLQETIVNIDQEK